ncbi:hypothetical protein IEO70_03865 [Bacillus sp. AGMB 02131]|uniref:Uncharacterized protein n=1 Tax=Peribacillus faecalis TaxID=2772559 RepID=A0A927CTC1_9BACI|nr:hypothetical protein [Peribacillus faecalis]MBD3107492.1 hypothetical protein [Peribacillus faecalis]
MIYTIKTQRGILTFLFALNSASLLFESEGASQYIFYLQCAIQIVILIGLIIKYELKIDDGYLSYRMSLFGMEFYKKRITPQQIKQMKFVRVGWLSKGAIVQMEKGFNIRVTHFSPETVVAELLDFAHKHEVPIFKTRDFVILEK